MSVKLKKDFNKLMEWMRSTHPEVHAFIQANLKPATNEQINAAEAIMKQSLANDLKEFLKITNGFPTEPLRKLLRAAPDHIDPNCDL